MTELDAGQPARRLETIDLNLLPLLMALLRERSVTRAATHVGLSQPAMSNALKRLRRLLDDPLLVGAPGAYQLTPRAHSVLGPLERALAALEDDVLRADEFDPAHSTRTFRIAASSSTAFVVLRPVIARAVEHWPNLSFTVVGARRWADRMFDDADLDLVLLPEVLTSEHPRERLYEEQWVVVVDHAHDEVGDGLSVEHMYSLPHAVYEDAGLRTHAELAASAGNRAVRTAVVTDDFMSLFHLVPGTRLWAFVQAGVARVLAAPNGLRIVAAPTPLPPFGIDMVWSPLRRGDSACAWLADELRSSAPSPERVGPLP